MNLNKTDRQNIEKKIIPMENSVLENILSEKPSIDKVTESLDKRVFDKINTADFAKKEIRIDLYIKQFAAIAAVFILSITTFFYFNKQTDPVEQNVVHSFIIKENQKSEGKINPGDLITTENNAGFTARFTENTYVRINEKSSIKIDNVTSQTGGREIKISLISGSALFVVGKLTKGESFEVKTALANITVVGTVFKVESGSRSSSDVTVYEGIVTVKHKFNGNEYFVHKGEHLSLKDSSEIRNLSGGNSKELNDLLSDISKENKQTIAADKIIVAGRAALQKPVIHITGTAKYTLVVTENELICFDADKNSLWNKQFSTETGKLFSSRPVIVNDKIYLSTSEKDVISLNIATGETLSTKQASGNVSFGYPIQSNGTSLFYPFADGLYTSSIYDATPELLINKQGISAPLIHGGILYSVSYITKELAAYTLAGKELFSAQLINRAFSMPVLLDNTLLVTDTKGIMYQYTENGNLIRKVQLNSGAVSTPCISGKRAYILCTDGLFYEFNNATGKVRSLASAYKNTDKNELLYIAPVINNGRIYIGTDKGELLTHDIASDTSSLLPVSENPITASAWPVSNGFFVGDKNGIIYYIPDTAVSPNAN